MRFFFFGTLRDRDILAIVLGRALPPGCFAAAWLAGYRVVTVRRQTFPMLAPQPGGRVEGIMVDGLGSADVERIMFFESVDYRPQPLLVTTAAGALTASVFLGTGQLAPGDDPWRFEDWLARLKPAELRATRLWMGLFGHLSVAEADRLWEAAHAAGESHEALVEAVRAGRHPACRPMPAPAERARRPR
jgi:hypothetical protein